MNIGRGQGARPELGDERRHFLDDSGALPSGRLQREEKPELAHAGGSAGNARSRFSAYATDCLRTASRSPSR